VADGIVTRETFERSPMDCSHNKSRRHLILFHVKPAGKTLGAVQNSLHGHPIFLQDEQWLYEDTKTPTIGSSRACGHCGKMSTKEGHDGCLGTLPDVMNACCGHGVANDAYIQFSHGRAVHGKEAVAKIAQLSRG